MDEVGPMICAFTLSLLIATVLKLFSGVGESEICLLLVKELAEALVARFSSLVLLDQGIKIIFKEITSLMAICHDKIYEEFVEEMTFSVMCLGEVSMDSFSGSPIILSSRESESGGSRLSFRKSPLMFSPLAQCKGTDGKWSLEKNFFVVWNVVFKPYPVLVVWDC